MKGFVQESASCQVSRAAERFLSQASGNECLRQVFENLVNPNSQGGWRRDHLWVWAFLEDSAFQELGNVLACVSWESPFSLADGSKQRRWRGLVSLPRLSSPRCRRPALRRCTRLHLEALSLVPGPRSLTRQLPALAGMFS